MKQLIIAEKPSVARDLAAALGKVPRKGDWFENEHYVISSAVGHLVELFMPEDIDRKLKRWTLKSLPIIPDNFQLKPIAKTKSKFMELKRLIHRKDIDEIINACDAAREGELIFSYIVELAKNRKPIKRLWLRSMTRTGILQAFKALRDDGEMHSLQAAARCRSEADWLIGMNGTRAVTKRIFGQVASVGRVQTPTLAIIVEREREISNFKPRDYWRIVGKFALVEGQYEGVYQKPGWKKSSAKGDRVDRIWDVARAEKIVEAVKDNPMAEVTEEKKRTKRLAPRLYDLTTLQRGANARLHLSAKRTLDIAQALYERHKLITYPRTDSQALPQDYVSNCRNVLQSLPGEYGKLARTALRNNWVRPNKRIFNNALVSDHFAIIPTKTSPGNLNAYEARLYDMIMRRFIAVFYPPAEFDITTRTSVVRPHGFKTEGKVMVKPGWLTVYGKDTKGKDNLVPLTQADGSPACAKVVSVDLKKETTKPPPRYSEATLLSAMEGAGKRVDDKALAQAMKEKGLGTPATRADTIERLLAQKYLERERREIIPTTKAEYLLDFLSAIEVETLTSPSLTGEWEHRLHHVEQGSLSREEFMSAIVAQTEDIISKVKNYSEENEVAKEVDVTSPSDNKPMLENFRAFKSQDGKVTVYKVIGNRKLSQEELRTLLSQGKLGPLEGFRSKAGKPYTATLVLDENYKVRFKFDNDNDTNSGNQSAEKLQFDALPVVGTCPLHQTPVYETETAYACRERLETRGNGKGFRMSKTILSRPISREQVVKLLSKGKTDQLDKFISKRTKKPFSASLVLQKNGSVQFAFPPRPVKNKKPRKRR